MCHSGSSASWPAEARGCSALAAHRPPRSCGLLSAPMPMVGLRYRPREAASEPLPAGSSREAGSPARSPGSITTAVERHWESWSRKHVRAEPRLAHRHAVELR